MGRKRRTKGLAPQRADLLDWLADLIGGDIVLTEGQVGQGSYGYVCSKVHFSSFVVLTG